jgi:EmrB/QacA subfamily drug resistance transporter
MSKVNPALAQSSQRGLVWLVAGAFFMELLDSTVITTALPQMAESFHTEAIHMSTGVSAYMLALAVFIPLSGWMANRFGPRQVFGGAIMIFTIASLLCSASTNLWQFSAARILQGFGGAMMVPVGRMVVLQATPKDKLVNAIAMLTWPALGAPVLGPALGGFITSHWGWHWIFWLNLPFGLAGFALTMWLVDAAPGKKLPFDTKGFILSGVGCSSLMFACDIASHTPFSLTQVSAAGMLGLVTLAWSAYHFKHTPHPLVDVDALHIPTFFLSMRGGSLFRMAINSAPFLMPMMFQLSFGYDPTKSGMLLLALFAGNICIKPATTPLMRNWGFRTVLLVNGFLVALGFVLSMALTATTPIALIMILLFFTGMTRSMQFTGLSTFSFCDVPNERMGGASTLSSILLQMASGLGIAFGAIALRVASIWFLPTGEQIVSRTCFQVAFAVMAVLSLMGLADLWKLAPNAGANVSGHRPNGGGTSLG